MRKMLVWACVLVACISVTSMKQSASVEAEPIVKKPIGENEPPAAGPTLYVGDVPADWLRPMPADARLWRHPLAPSKDVEAARLGHHDQKIVYRNTSDNFALVPGAGRRIADDIFTEMVENCGLDRFITRVAGVVPESEGGGEGTFDVTVSLMDRCPNLLSFNAPAIPGTEYRFRDLSDLQGDITELEYDFAHGLLKIGGAAFPLGICTNNKACNVIAQDCADGSPCVAGSVPDVPPSFWVRLEFHSNRGGWLSGDPAIRGFSGDQFSDILFGCNAYYGGFPGQPHASFYGEAYVEDTLVGSPSGPQPVCPTHFLAYLARNPQAEGFAAAPPGTDVVRMADDIEMIVDECELSVIEVETRGLSGEYEIEFDLRNIPTDGPFLGPDGQPLVWTFQSRSDQEGGGRGQIEIARQEFQAETFIEQQKFWLTWQANKVNTRVLNIQRTQAGGDSICNFMFQAGINTRLHCNHMYMAQNLNQFGMGNWSPIPPLITGLRTPDLRDAIFSAAVYCRGEPPRGACCINQPDVPDQPPACIDDDGEGNGVTVLTCADGRWLKDVTCPADYDPATFDPWEDLGQPRCGEHSCCQPNNNCDDLSRDACVAITDDDNNPSRWFRGRFCFDADFGCPWFACFDAANDCTVSAGDIFDPVGCVTDADCDELDTPDFDSICKFEGGGNGFCTIPKGCAIISCCDHVCDEDDFCCVVGWDQDCADLAADCPGPPGNDNCWDLPGSPLGAREITLGEENCPFDVTYCGNNKATHAEATRETGEPTFYCHKQAPDTAAVGTVWYKFRAGLTGSARIFTCNSAGSSDNQDSIVQVFRVTNENAGVCDNDAGICDNTGAPCSVSSSNCPSEGRCLPSTPCFYDGPGSTCPDLSECVFDERSVCQNLSVIGCNDDAGGNCGSFGGNSSLCVTGLDAGELYYIQVGVASVLQAGEYQVDVRQPCSNPPPTNSFCEGSLSANTGTQFNLQNHTFQFPAEACVPNMKNDAWYEHTAQCTGSLLVETCGPTPSDPDPDTTLVVYRGTNCPPGDPLGCNDDALVDEDFDIYPGRFQFCDIAGVSCDTDEDCPETICSTSAGACTVDDDCDAGLCDISTQPCSRSNNQCVVGICSELSQSPGAECTVSTGIPCAGFCERETCLLNESCVADTCVGSCGNASAVNVPAFQGEVYKIRVGGFQGSAATGEFTFTCLPQDCNGNGQPDGFDISEDCIVSCSTDLNQNGVPDDCDINVGECANGSPCFSELDCIGGSQCTGQVSQDCNDNGIPDEAEIHFASTCGPGPFHCLADCADDTNNNCIPDECEVGCPVPGVDGPAIDWTPDDGTVDAREPRMIDDGTFLKGIGGDAANAIAVVAPSGADPSCWSMCETQVEGAANDIESVVDNGDDTYTITLQRPITAGAITKITYTDGNDVRYTTSYTSLPADSDGSELVERADIDAHVGCCLDASCAPFGVYSCDMNDSAAITVEDLARLVDLLNNAGDFERSWEGETPDVTINCPD